MKFQGHSYWAACAALMLAGFQYAAVAGLQNPIGATASVEGGATRTLKVGDAAPDFELPDQSGKIVRLSDFKGKNNVVLAFYVLAFTGG